MAHSSFGHSYVEGSLANSDCRISRTTTRGGFSVNRLFRVSKQQHLGVDCREKANRTVISKKPTTDSGAALGTPDSYPVSPPTPRPTEVNWILQTILELQNSIGQLTQAVKTLSEDTKDYRKKLDSISHRFYAATAVLTAIGAILYFLLKQTWGQLVDILAKLATLK